jgi:metallophosphoesterase superfamily enzyme
VDKIEVLILPAYSPMAVGAAVNSSKKSKFLSDWLQNIDTSGFEPIVIDKNEILKFPPLDQLEPAESYEEWFERL